MSETDWFKNEIQQVNNFIKETGTILAMVEAYDTKLSLLNEEKKQVEEDEETLLSQGRLMMLQGSIEAIEIEIKDKLGRLQLIKESYMAEEILDTIETIAAVEGGELLGDEACRMITNMNCLLKKYGMNYLA